MIEIATRKDDHSRHATIEIEADCALLAERAGAGLAAGDEPAFQARYAPAAGALAGYLARVAVVLAAELAACGHCARRAGTGWVFESNDGKAWFASPSDDDRCRVSIYEDGLTDSESSIAVTACVPLDDAAWWERRAEALLAAVSSGAPLPDLAERPPLVRRAERQAAEQERLRRERVEREAAQAKIQRDLETEQGAVMDLAKLEALASDPFSPDDATDAKAKLAWLRARPHAMAAARAAQSAQGAP